MTIFKHYTLLAFICIAFGHLNAGTSTNLNESQVAKLISAGWNKPVVPIDSTIYKEVINRHRDIEDIQKEVQEMVQRANSMKEKMKHPGVVFRDINVEDETRRLTEFYNQPRLFVERIRINGNLYRLDQTTINSNTDMKKEDEIRKAAEYNTIIVLQVTIIGTLLFFIVSIITCAVIIYFSQFFSIPPLKTLFIILFREKHSLFF